jgi:tetratricopeptide (TPR) repeat protein
VRERLRQFGAVVSCLRNLARRQPVLLCLDDLHAADAATLNLIHYLARQVHRLPITVVGTLRLEEAQRGDPLQQMLNALAHERLAEQLHLTPLRSEDTRRLVTSLLDGVPGERLTEWLHATAEGNPLFVEQLVLALRENRQLEQHDDTWRRTTDADSDGDGDGVPSAVLDVIRQRLERRSTRTRETLAVASVLGQTFQYESLLAALDTTVEAELLTDLDEALSAQLLRETQTGYAFGHTLLHEAMYRSLSGPTRMRLHARVGETLERLAGDRAPERASELARHFTLGGRLLAVRHKALTYSLEAGRRAAALSAHREALLHFRRALTLIEQGLEVSQSIELTALEGRGRAERQMAMWLPSIETFRRVLARSDDPAQRARAHGGIAYALHHTDRAAEALAEVDAGLADVNAAPEGRGASLVRFDLELEKALHLFLLGKYREQLELGQSMLAWAAPFDEPRPLDAAQTATGIAFMGLGDLDRALEHFELSRAAAERAGDKIQLAIAHENLGLAQFRSGRFPLAHGHLDRALEAYGDTAAWQSGVGPGSRAVNTLQALARVLLAEGNVNAARGRAENAFRLATQANDRWAAECHHVLASIHALKAEWELAEARFHQALEIRDRVGHAAGIVETLLALGVLHERRGEPARARDAYVRATEVAARMDPSLPVVAASRHLGRLLVQMGDVTAGGAFIGRAAALAARMERSLEYSPTLLAVAELNSARGDLLAALEYAARAVDIGGPAEFVVEARAALIDLLLALGRVEPCTAHVREALDVAERLATPHARGLALLAAGRVASADGDRDAARRYFDLAVDNFQAAREPGAIARARSAVAELASTGASHHASSGAGLSGNLPASPLIADQ